MATTEDFIHKLLAEVGDEYEWGAEYPPGTDPSRTDEWDCSGLLYTKLNELGIPCPRTSGEIHAWWVGAGGALPLEEGKLLRGAILYMSGHIGVSLGDGNTVEASSSQGVAVLRNTFQRWTHAARVPGLVYVDGDSESPKRGDEGPRAEPRHPRRRAERPLLSVGSTGETVQDLQQRLGACGFDPGPIDGDFGPRTREAVLAFQRANGLVADGVVGPQTWSALLDRAQAPRRVTRGRR